MSEYHELKIWPKFFRFIESREKNFEIRKNDRNFRVGDNICLREFDPIKKEYTGQAMYGEIIYITDFMQAQGYVVFGFKTILKAVKS